MKAAKLLSLILAVTLQFMPPCRMVTSQLVPAASQMAIILRWGAGAAALLGACEAVSGASTVITSPLTATGTNGVAFSYRITTGPEVGNQYAAAPLPPGLTVNTSSGRITGTPTASSSWSVVLTASDSGIPNRTVTATLGLTILPGGSSAPSITTQPQSQSVSAGANASFSVVAGGAAPLSYQWRFGGAALVAQTSSALTLNAVTANQGGNYTVVVSNLSGSVTSSVAVLTVTAPAVAPTITTQPQSQTVTAGTSASFSVSANGTAPLSYQWRFGNSALAAQTGSALTLANVAGNQAGSYTVVVANSGGSATSSVAVLTVLLPPTITAQPQNLSVVSGDNAAFSVTAVGTATLSYQWRWGGAALTGQTSSALALAAVTTNNAGNYSVVIANSVGSVTSSVAVLTVTAAAVAPSIITQPQRQTVYSGASISFSILAAGTAPLGYQWRFGPNALAGQTNSTLNLSAVTANQAGSYAVVVTNIAGSVTSAVAVLTVNSTLPPVLTIQPESQTVFAGADVKFTVAATGTAPLSCQWLLGDAELPAQTNWTLALTGVSTNQAGGYAAVVSNFAGSLTSSVAVLTVDPPQVAPTITTQPVSLTVMAGGSAAFSVEADGAAPFQYQWCFNGSELPAQTNAMLSLVSVTTNLAGSYFVVVSNLAGAATSTVAQLTITPPPLVLALNEVAGWYNGLLYDPNGIQLGSSGFFTLRLSRQGAYSASLSLSGGWRLSASGRLDSRGKGTNTLLRGRASPVVVNWLVDLAGSDRMTGTATSASWSAEILGDRCLFNARTNPCPNAGQYTFILPGTPGEPSLPEGDSYGTAVVDKNGVVVLKGRLADRAAIAQRVPLSRNGDWPLFVPLYSRTGALIAWLHFENLATDDFSGALSCMKPSVPTDLYYPAGFEVVADMTGSLYVPPKAPVSLPMRLTNAVVTFSGGGLSDAGTNPITLGASPKLASAGPNRVYFSFSAPTGLFKGSFTPVGSSRRIAFGGVVFQKANAGFGWFPGSRQAGRVVLQNGP